LARRRIVVTGLGLISPVGNSVEEGWQNIIAGRSGIAPITKFDTSTFPVQFAGEVKNFDITQYIAAKDARRMDTFIHFGLAAGIQAVRDAGLEPLQVACELALDSGVITGAVVMNELRRLVAPNRPEVLEVPDRLQLQTEPLADCARYDALRGGGHVLH
jgi:3-oxoacyl-(acyl-carrier-protein) synthase